MADQDGWGALDFHSKVDERGPTVTVIKTTSGNIFGAYTDISWSPVTGGKYVNGKGNSFIFFFKGGSIHKMAWTQGEEVYHDGEWLACFYGGFYIKPNANENADSYTFFDGQNYMWPEGTTISDSDHIADPGSKHFQVVSLETWLVNDE